MHVLMVGGSGMLATVTQAQLAAGPSVSLLARQPGRVAGANPLAVDYHDSEQLAQALRRAIELHGPVELAVCWVHTTAPQALPVIGAELARPGRPFRLIHIRGSAAAAPSAPGYRAPDWVPAECAYQQVVLGWEVEDSRSRWLTHQEIATGVLAAIGTPDEPVRVIGQVRPWEQRPGW